MRCARFIGSRHPSWPGHGGAAALAFHRRTRGSVGSSPILARHSTRPEVDILVSFIKWSGVREKRFVAGNDRLRPAREGAFEDAVIGGVLQHGEAPARFDDRADVGEEERDAGELFSVPGELSGKNAEKLSQDRP